MKKLWKFLGITALAAVLLPYRVEGDEETDEVKVDALLWHVTCSGRSGDRRVDITFGRERAARPDDGTDGLDAEPDILDEDFDDLDEAVGQVERGADEEITVTETQDGQQAPTPPEAPAAPEAPTAPEAPAAPEAPTAPKAPAAPKIPASPEA